MAGTKAKWIMLVGVGAVILLGIGMAESAKAVDDATAEDNAVALTVTSRAYDLGAIAASAEVPEDIHAGRTIWLQRCAYCHDGVGQPSYNTMGPWIGAETIDKFREIGFRTLVESGTARMPGFGYTLDEAQMANLIAFVRSVGSDQKPTPAQLADGRSAAPVSGD